MNIVALINGGSTGGGGKTVLTAALDVYVATTGSNTTGTGSSSSPWQTIQYAIDYVKANYDRNGYATNIHLADGTYTGNVSLTNDTCVNVPFNIIGNSTTPANVIVTATTGDTIYCSAGKLVLSYFELRSTAGSGLAADVCGEIDVQTGMRLGACAQYHMNSGNGGLVKCLGNYSIVGSAANHYLCWNTGKLQSAGITVTITGTPAFASGFVQVVGAGFLGSWGNTWSGSATGSRYGVDSNGTIMTYGSGASYFPGSSSGTAGASGVYV